MNQSSVPSALSLATYLSSDVAGFQAVISFHAVSSILLLLASQLLIVSLFLLHPCSYEPFIVPASSSSGQLAVKT
jgi:hypothetical protein